MGSSHSRHSSRPKVSTRKKAKLPARFREVAQQLQEVVHRLNAVYSCCVTAQRALDRQNGDQDADIARCLRTTVSKPIALISGELHTLVAKMVRQ